MSVFCVPCCHINNSCTHECYNINLLLGYGNHHYTCFNPCCYKHNCLILKKKMLHEIKNIQTFCCSCQKILLYYDEKKNKKMEEINKMYLLFFILSNITEDLNGDFIIGELHTLNIQDIDYWFIVINHIESNYCENAVCTFPGCYKYKKSDVVELSKFINIINIFDGNKFIDEFIDIVMYINNKILIKHVSCCNTSFKLCGDSDCFEQKLLLYVNT